MQCIKSQLGPGQSNATFHKAATRICTPLLCLTRGCSVQRSRILWAPALCSIEIEAFALNKLNRPRSHELSNNTSKSKCYSLDILDHRKQRREALSTAPQVVKQIQNSTKQECCVLLADMLHSFDQDLIDRGAVGDRLSFFGRG